MVTSCYITGSSVTSTYFARNEKEYFQLCAWFSAVGCLATPRGVKTCSEDPNLNDLQHT